MLSETPVTITICLGPVLVSTPPTTSAGNKLCISRGWLSSLSFQRSFMSLTLAVVSVVSFCCQAVRCGLPPSVSQSAGLRPWLKPATHSKARGSDRSSPKIFTNFRDSTSKTPFLFNDDPHRGWTAELITLRKQEGKTKWRGDLPILRRHSDGLILGRRFNARSNRRCGNEEVAPFRHK